MKEHKYCYFECINCKDISETRLDNIKEENILYCRDCMSAPIIQYYICEDCSSAIEVDSWDINNKKTPYCGTCSAKRIAKNMTRVRRDDYFKKSMESKELSWISRSSLYHGLYNLEYSDTEANEIIGNRGFTYWRIKCNLEPNFKGDLTKRNPDGTWVKITIEGVRDIYLESRDALNKWKYKILKRDEFKCQICNDKDRLEVHHNKEKFVNIINKFSKDYRDKSLSYKDRKMIADKVVKYHYENDVSGITLCKNCHIWIHNLNPLDFQ